MKRWKNVAMAATIGGAALLAATVGTISNAASNQVASGATTTASSNDTSALTTIQKSELQKLSADNGYLKGWLSESKLLFYKENTNQKVKADGRYPMNIFVYDLETGKEAPLLEDKLDMEGPIVSPDQQYIFYAKENGVRESFGDKTEGGVNVFYDTYMYNVKAGTSVKIGSNKNVNAVQGTWLDNTHYIYSTPEGDLVSVDVDGQSQTLVQTGQALSILAVDGSNIYYGYTDKVSKKGTTVAYNTQTKKSETTDNISWIGSSKDKSVVAMMKAGSLVLADAKGNVKSTIAKGNLVDNAPTLGQTIVSVWPYLSPDGTNLSYTVSSDVIDYKPHPSTSEQFIYNLATGKKTQVSVDKDSQFGGTSWSPSGKKAIISTWANGSSTYYVMTIS
jgi:TolB protein